MEAKVMEANEIRVSVLKEMVEFLESEIKNQDELIAEAQRQVKLHEERYANADTEYLKMTNDLSVSRWKGIKRVSESTSRRLTKKLNSLKEEIRSLQDDWLAPTKEEYSEEEHEMWLLEQQEGNYKGGTQSWDM